MARTNRAKMLIIDPQYKAWIRAVSDRFRQSRLEAAVKVNEEMLRFYWFLGRDISSMGLEAKYGTRFYHSVSADLQENLPDIRSFTVTNLKYKGNPDKALFCVRKTLENNWSRTVLMNCVDADPYERQGKTVSIFALRLPAPQSDLARPNTFFLYRNSKCPVASGNESPHRNYETK